MTITLDPITKRFTQVLPEEKTCYICNGNNFVDDHHYDFKHGKISDEVVPLCRRCHKTIHMFNGIHMFEDNLLDRAIEVWNKTQALLKRPLMTKDKIERSEYWLKKHGIEGGEDRSGIQTPAFPPFHFPHGEPLCGWDWVNEHLYDLLDYVPRIEVRGPDIDLAVDISNKRELGKVSKALKGLKGNNSNKRVVTLDSKTKRFKEVQNVV